MRTFLSRLFVLTTMALCLAGAAVAADVDGTWAGVLDTPLGDIAQVFTFKTDGAVLTGTVNNPEGQDVTIADGTVEDNRLSFSATVQFMGKPRLLTYRGLLAKDAIVFEVVLNSEHPRTFKEVVTRKAVASGQPAPTFNRNVAPILYRSCAGCHRPGEMAPMSLLTYEQVRPWATAIREKVALGQMPPWHSVDPRGTFENDRRLTDAEKAIIDRWVATGAQQGNPADVLPAPHFSEGWQIGTPDVVLGMLAPYEVHATGDLPYQNFTVPTQFTEDKWVQAIEVRAGARQVVHHILVFAKDPAAEIRPDAFTQTVPPGNLLASLTRKVGTLIATTAPGTNAMVFPGGTAMRIAAGSMLTLQIHYTPNGSTPVSDQSSVGIVFARQAPRQEMRTTAFANPRLKLPAGDPNVPITTSIVFDEDVHVTALFPHTHLRGIAWEYRLIYPDGRSEALLSVPHYDFNWQTYYVFATRRAVPKGARIEAVAHYDNSPANKANPNPAVDVYWGEQTSEEMQYTGINYTVDSARF
jgi:mono/diheme cytochrome c family protein